MLINTLLSLLAMTMRKLASEACAPLSRRYYKAVYAAALQSAQTPQQSHDAAKAAVTQVSDAAFEEYTPSEPRPSPRAPPRQAISSPCDFP